MDEFSLRQFTSNIPTNFRAWSYLAIASCTNINIYIGCKNMVKFCFINITDYISIVSSHYNIIWYSWTVLTTVFEHILLVIKHCSTYVIEGNYRLGLSATYRPWRGSLTAAILDYVRTSYFKWLVLLKVSRWSFAFRTPYFL